MLRHKVHIDGRNDNIQQHADGRRGSLDDDIADTATVVIGAGDHHKAEHRGGQTKQKQHNVALAEEAFQFLEVLAHGIASFTDLL